MCVNCLNITNTLSNEYLDGLNPIFAQAMRDLYKGKIKPEDLQGELLSHIAQELWRGVSIDFDTDYSKHSTDSDHYRLIRDFEENVYVFSGFKTYHELREASLMMYDESGAIKPFTQFLKDVQSVNKIYNVTYLRAEYDNAVVTGQMVNKWESFADDDMLKFKAVMDDHTTAICHSLNGLVKPKSWPGWKKYWLPLHWGERSNIIQTMDDATDEHEDDLQNPPDMFSGNAAVDGIIFPETHPYFDACSGKTRVANSANCIKTKATVEYRSLSNMPYRLLEQKDGFQLETHPTFERYETNVNETMRLAQFIFQKGNSIRMLKMNPFTDGLKNPDCLIGDQIFELKSTSSVKRATIDKMVKEASLQANNIVLEVNSDLSRNKVLKMISERVRREKGLSQVWIKIGDLLHKYDAQTIRKMYKK